jgi:serine protease DegQ
VRRAFALLPVLLLLVACVGDDGADRDEAAPAGTGTAVEAARPEAAAEGDLIPGIVRDVAPSVVAVSAGRAEGSGVVWSADGVVVTNEHVIRGNRTVEIALATGERIAGTVEATDPITDLAIVRVEREGLPAATFTERQAVVGDLAIAVGNPLGFEGSVTAGIVSGLHRALPASGGEGPNPLVDLLQTDAAISPGNSGGALVNRDGEVMGINVAYIPPAARAVSIGFAIPAYTVVDVVEQLLEDGVAEHAFLGVTPADLTPELAQRFGIDAEGGVVVLTTSPGTAADAAGLQAGDLIVAADGEALRRVEDLLALLRQRSPGDTLALRILRGGQELALSATLTDRPAQ